MLAAMAGTRAGSGTDGGRGRLGSVGAVLVTRRPRHPVGWLLLGLGVSMIGLGAASDYASYTLLAGAGPLPGARWVALAAVLAGVAAALAVVGTVTGTEALWLWATAAYVVVLPQAGPAAARQLQPGRGRGHPGRGRHLPAGPPPHQQVVDRRFNRRRYDTARTIESFSARLRQQVDLDTLTAELLAGADQTVQPTAGSLWLRPAPRR